jgi:hypothetical protein
MTCVDPLQLGIMGRNMPVSVASDWWKLSHGHNVCSDWLNLESFLFAAQHSWQAKGGHQGMFDLALL